MGAMPPSLLESSLHTAPAYHKCVSNKISQSCSEPPFPHAPPFPFLPPIMPITAGISPPRFSEDFDSTCSTPFVSAPSSPAHAPPSGYFFSAPTSPTHHLFSGEKPVKTSPSEYEPVYLSSDSGSFEFEFSSRFSPNRPGVNASMTSADELFFNGQIRPVDLSSQLRRSQEGDVASIVDLYNSEVRGRDFNFKSRSVKKCHRKARSMSPLRAAVDYERKCSTEDRIEAKGNESNESNETTPSVSASSSRSSSTSGRNSKKWIFLKDLLHRSKSEGRANNKDRFWSAISFSPAKERKKSTSSPALSPSSSRDDNKGKNEAKKKVKIPSAGKPAHGVWKRWAPPSAHELHYTANRAQAEEMKKKTFLPYRQGLLGCLGFSSKSYGAFSGFTKNLNPISSR